MRRMFTSETKVYKHSISFYVSKLWYMVIYSTDNTPLTTGALLAANARLFANTIQFDSSDNSMCVIVVSANVSGAWEFTYQLQGSSTQTAVSVPSTQGYITDTVTEI